MKVFFMRFAVFFVTIAVAVTCLFNGTDRAGAGYEAEDPDAVLLNTVIVSDLHTEDSLNDDCNKVLMQLFSGIDKSKTPLDALILPGDITNSGTQAQYNNLASFLKRYNHARDLIAATGNHDARGNTDVEDHAKNLERYTAFCKVTGIQTDTPYWAKTVNGYPFIVLGSEADLQDRAFFSDEQLRWLDAQLTAAEQTGKPAFIICHQVIDHTNNVDWWWYFDGSVGEQSDALRDLIRSHTDNGLTVLFISGHLHRCFCADSLEQPWPNLYCLNVPTVQDNVQVEGAREESGEGCTMEVYADRVIIRPRNFITGEWLPETYTIPLS